MQAQSDFGVNFQLSSKSDCIPFKKFKPDFIIHLRFEAPKFNGYKYRSFNIKGTINMNRRFYGYTERLESDGIALLHRTQSNMSSNGGIKCRTDRRRMILRMNPDEVKEQDLENVLKKLVKDFGGYPDTLQFTINDGG